MTTSVPGEMTGWSALADCSEEERRAQMGKRYAELLHMPEEQRVSALERMGQVEYRLSDGKLRTFTESRLLVWLGMDMEKGLVIARSYDQAMLRMPGTAAMKRVSTEQTVARGFTAEQLDRLRELIPATLKVMPQVSSARFSTPSPQPKPAAAEQKPSKGFLGFGKRK
ncbi:MAG: hypothetical protein HW388_1333 [Dehalococcoidia bacterium]|nr:hypothetical protein [Dehalococcoidia bacterium]